MTNILFAKHRLLTLAALGFLLAACGGVRSGTSTALPIPAVSTLASALSATPEWAAYVSDEFRVRVMYPAYWQRAPGGDLHLEGPDGFLSLNLWATPDESTGALRSLCDNQAHHKLLPYGSQPQITSLVVAGQEACLIMPSADQDPTMKSLASVMVRLPEPIDRGGDPYRFLSVDADQNHIRPIAERLAFITPATPATSTPAPAPGETPFVIPGPEIAYGNMHLVLPSAVASSVNARTVPKSEAGADMPYWAVYPAYIELAFADYPLQGAMHSARIEVYPAREYAAMSPLASSNIADLQAMLSQAPNLPPGKIPFLPLFNSGQVFRAQIKFLDFKSGKGIHFITQYDQDPMPINNREVFYTYQGLTNGGAYYVAAILPIHVPILPSDERVDGPVPPGGVPLPDFNSGDPVMLFTGYLQSVADTLNATPADQFTPSLDALDALVQSIEVK